ncbi:phage tail protein [Sphingomonas sp. SUN039]|uniref:phage tail protein n=1 Tax=Sphingomonas sp. SUN039 TaxID=2937787 RepID=UPI0021640D0C|nr:phage tail protein [Sphingomonas sp. SUN039]UVO52978.1 phage tail protein [Sphingomonas sp. SUN039]
MATLILTAVGSALGGPIGGAIGAIAGQAIDQAVFKPAARQGPQLTDLAVQTSTYGAQIPQLFGRVRVAGTVIWATDLIETKKTQSNGKGRAATDTYSYSASFAVLLSGRRIVRVERIWADGKLLRGSAGDLKVELGALRIHDGDADQVVDPLVASAEGTDASAWRGSAYAVFEGLQLGDYGNRIPSLSFEVVADEGPVAVGAMLAELAGVSAEPGPGVTGFAATGGSVRAVAEAVQPAFPMICRDEGGAHLRFAPVAGASVAALDLGASTTAGRVAKVARDIASLDTTAAALTVAYLDPSRDYQAGLQRARREGPGLRDERVDLPATLDAAAAHAIATGALARRGIERRRASVSLPWRAMAARPGDRLSIEGEAWRVTELRFERMTVQLDLVRTDAAAASNAAVDPGRNVAQVDAVHGPTTLRVLDLPPMADTPVTVPVLGVVAAGVSPGWRRASLLASVDDGASYTPVGTTALPATMGTTATVLAAGPTGLIDRIDSVEIVLLNAAMTLSDADTAALLAGANRAMIGGEAIQFGRAAPVSSGRWRLSELWRGRRGTEDAVATHAIGTPFVLFEEATALILPMAQSVPGIRVMASGIGDSAPWPLASCATVMRAIRPLSPVRPTATRLPSGDTVIGWTRRSRAGWAWRDGIEVPLGEEREAYRVSWVGGSAETSEPLFTYTAAMRAADIAGGATAMTFTICQSGDAALSPPLGFTIDPI